MANSSSKSAYFVVEGRIQPKQRPKVYRGHAVTPQATVDYEAKVRSAYIAECGELKLTGALQIVMNLYVQIPSGTSKKNREKMLTGEIRPISRTGDIDNLYKAITDALNGVAYDDDSQIVEAVIRKWYLDEPKAEITIREE